MSEVTERWAGLYQFRRDIRKMYPNFWRIKIANKATSVVQPYLGENCRVLDVGSGNRQSLPKLKLIQPKLVFKSMDIDRSCRHDYYSLAEINEQFDLILLFEVIEHLDFPEGVAMLTRIKELLVPGGKLVMTTPNVFHPNRYWEYSHKVSYRYDEIGGLLLSLDFGIKEIFRIYNNAFIPRLIRLYLAAPIHRYFDIDFARSIAVVAEKK